MSGFRIYNDSDKTLTTETIIDLGEPTNVSKEDTVLSFPVGESLLFTLSRTGDIVSFTSNKKTFAKDSVSKVVVSDGALTTNMRPEYVVTFMGTSSASGLFELVVKPSGVVELDFDIPLSTSNAFTSTALSSVSGSWRAPPI